MGFCNILFSANILGCIQFQFLHLKVVFILILVISFRYYEADAAPVKRGSHQINPTYDSIEEGDAEVGNRKSTVPLVTNVSVNDSDYSVAL